MWRFLNAAVRGTSHERGDTPCQDDCVVDVVRGSGDVLLVAIASDGAGSAARAEEGSGLVCEALLREVTQWSRGAAIEELSRAVAEGWVVCLRDAIDERAAQKQLTIRDFACTLVAAVIGPQAAAFIQIGDGAIVTGIAGAYDVVFWPDGGEYANMTYFVTDDDWSSRLHFEIRSVSVDEIVLMTDGLQRLALRFDSRTAHAPFFVPMFTRLRNTAEGFASDLESRMVAFLSSDVVNARTDDDKSLVLASRGPRGTHGIV
jgi:protein phosphatase 2C-like protein